MKLLLMVTAIFELLAGVGLFTFPALVISTALNTPLDTPAGLFAARLAGAALISIAICCWQLRNAEGTAAQGIIASLLFYNIAAAVVLAYGDIRLGLQSPFIWPAIVAHSALAIWCGAWMRWTMRRQQKASNTTEIDQ